MQCVRWAGALEWLPDLAQDLLGDALIAELTGRPATVRARVGYLVQGMRPDLAEIIRDLGRLSGKSWFGPRGTLRRHDAGWQVADTLLPFDPRGLRPVG